MKHLFILLSVFITISVITTRCSRKTILQKIDEGDLSGVYQGRYQGTTRFLRDGAEYKKTVDMIRREI